MRILVHAPGPAFVAVLEVALAAGATVLFRHRRSGMLALQIGSEHISDVRKAGGEVRIDERDG